MAAGWVLGYLARKGWRLAARADEQVDRAVDAGARGLGTAIGRRLSGDCAPPADAAVPPSVPGGDVRRWALVESAVSPVHREPDATREPLKHKYRHDRVELFTGLAPHEGWLAVRTPLDAPGYQWMPAGDLRVIPLPEDPVERAAARRDTPPVA